MAETTTITLGGTPYTIRKFTIGQLRRLLSSDVKAGDFGFLALELALARAEPKAPPMDDMEIDVAEFNAAIAQITEFSGIKRAGEKAKGEARAEAPAAT